MATGSSDYKAVPAAIRERLAAEYDKAGFFDRYGQDVWIVVIVTFLVLAHAFHTQLQAFYASLRADWVEHRYNPLYMPIAGHVHKGDGQSAMEATAENFAGAIMKIVVDLVQVLLIPLMLVMQIIMALFEALLAAIQAIRALFDKLRNSMADMLQDIMGRILAMNIPMQHFTVTLRDLLKKATGMLVGSAFLGTGGFLTIFSALLNLLSIVVVILIALAVVMVVLMIAADFFPVFWIPFALDTAIFLLILIPFLIVKSILDDVHSSHHQFFSPSPSKNAPSMPTCFAGSTPLDVRGKGRVPLKDIEVGDQLERGGTVTGTFRLSAQGQDIVVLKGVTVTGNHSVLHATRGWIPAREHEDATAFRGHHPKYVYCLVTTSKRIPINGLEFADWDDIDDDDMQRLSERAPLGANWTGDDLRRLLVKTHPADTTVVLSDRSNIRLSEAEPGMKLMGGGRCVGVARILQSTCVEYQLVVDNGRYYADGVLVHHYDHGIEQYLDAQPSQPQLFI